MSDVDVFEQRFAVAYRRYLAEADVDVDAPALVRSIALAAGPRRAAVPWPASVLRSPAWAVLITVVALAALAGAWLVGQQRALPQGWVGLTGRWSDSSSWAAVLVLHPCGPEQTCGTFELTVDSGSGPRCLYTLEHRPRDGDAYVYWTSAATGARFSIVHCAYDWVEVELRVTTDVAGSVQVQAGRRSAGWTLWPTPGSPVPELTRVDELEGGA